MACLNYPPHVAPRALKKFNHPYTKKKRGASPSLVPRVEAFALPYKSKRATLKAPRKCIYNHPTRYNPSIEMDTASWKECIQYTQGAFPLLCSWLIVELCENSTQSKPKRTVTPFMYMCLPKHPTHEGFQQGFDDAKIAKVLVSANFLTIFLCFTNKKAYLCTHHT